MFICVTLVITQSLELGSWLHGEYFWKEGKKGEMALPSSVHTRTHTHQISPLLSISITREENNFKTAPQALSYVSPL